MAYCNTIYSQILKFVPRHEFEALTSRHHSGRAFRTASRWSQFVTMAVAQLSGRNARANLSRINENKPHTLHETLLGKLGDSPFNKFKSDKQLTLI